MPHLNFFWSNNNKIEWMENPLIWFQSKLVFIFKSNKKNANCSNKLLESSIDILRDQWMYLSIIKIC